MVYIKMTLICMVVMTSLLACVLGDGYGNQGYQYANQGYQYAQQGYQYVQQHPSIHLAQAQPAYGYVMQGNAGGLSGGLSATSGGLIPILLIVLGIGILAPSLIASLQSVQQGTNNVLRSSGSG